MKANKLVLAGVVVAAALSCSFQTAAQSSPGSGKIRHVLLLSIDGMHAVDFYNCSRGISGANDGDPYCPNMTAHNIIGQYVYTAKEYTAELINMRNGDVFMGAFNAEQVIYNHFGYRTPIPNLYMAGSAGHPGGAISGGSGYISAGIIARDLGAKLWWQPADASAALGALAQAA